MLDARDGGGVLSETVAAVSLSTVPRLSLLSVGGGGLISLCFHAFLWGSNDATEVRGSFQETAFRTTAKNTVKHRDDGVGSVLAVKFRWS